MPDGVYYAQDQMEDDGVTQRPYWMRLRLTIRGNEASVTGPTPTSRRRVRSMRRSSSPPLPATAGFLHVVSDDIPINSGCPADPAGDPAGDTVNVKHRAVGRRQHGDPPAYPERRPGAGGAVPERVAAAEGASSCNFLFGGFHPEYGDYYTNYHLEERLGRHGRPRRQQRPVRQQWQLPQHAGRDPGDEIPVHRRGVPLAPRLGGCGRWRGGLASSRIFRVNAPEITVNALFDRTRTHGPGIFGGQEGASSGIFIQRPGDDRFRRFSETFGTVSDSKFTRVAVTEGDRIQLESAGGGGFGDPRERPRELVEEDVRQGVVARGCA